MYVLPLERRDWFNVARGIFTLGFWRSALTTDPGYTWYLDRLAETVDRARLHSGAGQVGGRWDKNTEPRAAAATCNSGYCQPSRVPWSRKHSHALNCNASLLRAGAVRP